MTTNLIVRLEIKSWDERPYEQSDGRKLTKTAVELGGAEQITSARMDGIMFYRPDGTSDYVSMMLVNASVDGEPGSFILQGSGSYDGVKASSNMHIVPGSGIGACAGITGAATSASTHDDYPYMPLTITYDL